MKGLVINEYTYSSGYGEKKWWLLLCLIFRIGCCGQRLLSGFSLRGLSKASSPLGSQSPRSMIKMSAHDEYISLDVNGPRDKVLTKGNDLKGLFVGLLDKIYQI